MSLRSPSILVTGATGYTGRWLVRHLLNQGAKVRAGDVCRPRVHVDSPTFSEADPYCETLDPRAEFVHLDVTNIEHVQAAVRGVDTIIHIAAVVPFNLPFSPPLSSLLRVNIKGTDNMLHAAQVEGVRNFIFASSTGVVFAGRDNEHLNERCKIPLGATGSLHMLSYFHPHEITPELRASLAKFDLSSFNDPYSFSKAVAEDLVLSLSSPRFSTGLACVAIRPNGIWGPGEAHHIPKVLTTAQLGASRAVFQGEVLTDFSHVKNVIHAIECALCALSQKAESRARVSGKAYFITDGWSCHTLEFFSPLLSSLHFSPPFHAAMIRVGTAYVTDTGQEAMIKSNCRVSPTEWHRLAASYTPVRRGERRRRRRNSANVMDSLTTPLVENDENILDGEEVIVTAPGPLQLPGWLLFPAGFFCELSSLLLSPFKSIEPFLTVADVRKVIRHNYYDSSLAVRELGYAPVCTPAAGMKELVSFYHKKGFDGRVASPPLLAWIAVVVGLLLTAFIGYDIGGVISGALVHISDNELNSVANVLHTIYNTLCFHEAGEAFTTPMTWLGSSIVPWQSYSSPVDTLFSSVRSILSSALLCHACQGIWAGIFAFKHGLAG
jgi:nucleoside-diphosphate-sugar epimerase